MILASNLESVTPASYDGTTLEIAFPPNRSYGVQKVEQRIGKLRDALQEVFGVTPDITFVVRDPVAGGVTVPEEDDEAESPDEDAALERLKSELNAEIADGDL
jgi:hypothetical protein